MVAQHFSKHITLGHVQNYTSDLQISTMVEKNDPSQMGMCQLRSCLEAQECFGHIRWDMGLLKVVVPKSTIY